MIRNGSALAALAGIGMLAAGAALAQVPPDIAAKLHEIGPTIDRRVGPIYAPLLPRPPYAGIVATHDLAYGPDPLQKLDVLTAEGAKGKRPVVVFVHGGGFTGGDKLQAPSPFYENVMVWAARHGLVGVNLDYRLAPKNTWPAGVEDMGAAVRWLHANIAKYGGDPDRIYLWGHSAGAGHVADYVAHTEFHPHAGPSGAGIAGAILMSWPYVATAKPSVYYADAAAVKAEAATRPGLLATKTPLMVINAELDPPGMIPAGKALKDDLCKAGHCPTYLLAKDHDHLSEGFAIGTADELVSGPVLKFITGTK